MIFTIFAPYAFLMRIYLIGYMSSGKTSLGRILAGKTGLGFRDLDEMIETRYRITIFDFFEKYGEESFRLVEQKELRETVILQDVIIATGGGTPCFFNNMSYMKQQGVTIYLRLSPDDLAKRIACIRKQRPLLKNIPAGKLSGFLRDHLAEREKHYMEAQYIIDGPEYPVSQMVDLLSAATKEHSRHDGYGGTYPPVVT
jgi:shikimate kinase